MTKTEANPSQRSPEAPSKDPAPKPKSGIPKPLRILAVLAVVAGLGYGVYRLFFYRPEPEGLFLSGRIESYDTDVSAKIGGRVAEVSVEEGDLVKPGQLLVRIDDSDLQAQLRGAIAQVRARQEELQRARQQLPVLEAQLQQANLTTEQANQESQGRVLESQNSLAAAGAQLVEAQSSLKLALIRQRRTRELFSQGAVSAQQRDEDDAQVETAQARVNAARQQVQASRGSLAQSRSTLQNPSIRAAAALEIQRQMAQARTDISVAQQQIRDAQATQAQIQANLNYLVIKSPLSGSVITRSVEPGEVVAAGAPLLTVVNLNRLYLRGFIPEGQIGQVRVGQTGRVYLDSFPDQPLEATVTRVDPKASFTPENTYFQKDRVTQVFGVELTLKDPQGFAKPGMPADGRILVPESQPQRSSTLFPAPLGILGR
ncbi:HlyD family secretion protein [Leptolyngbya sp. FACHB-261]|uniref:HlyD family secretion protein n=1 Tax=Leptolyngbya sp. FACHB-261 TaxID=2692806 RepID=UPI00168785C2|nr:HlyD family efflux transporter periplasmic adaptor subunit [Leptolyngbya sp. FACHB-261]MBD2101471.1 HlyD family secretion protein [Leptolyngbya sp. FACHB-261]